MSLSCLLQLLSSASPPELPPLHTTVCGGRPCLPGEGNPSVTHDFNPYTLPAVREDWIKGLPHEPDPASAQYAPLVAAAGRHSLVLLCAVDSDFRELAENWHRAIRRLGLSNAIVYALDAEAHQYLSARSVHVVDGSANFDAWNVTRLQRHIQRAEAERHVAAAALAASGRDVLLTDATHVLLHDVTPTLHRLAKDVDMALPRGHCSGEPPVGCSPWFNLVFLRGAGSPQQRTRAVAFQTAGVRRGLVDFYLRWWSGAHCIYSGFGKHFADCDPALVDGAAPDSIGASATTAVVALKGCGQARIGLLPDTFFNMQRLYTNGENRTAPFGMIARSPKPAQRDRLKLDRYDKQDFDELRVAMQADGLWFL